MLAYVCVACRFESFALRAVEIFEEKKKAKMLLQIHDELIFEVPEKDINSLSKIIKQEMMSVKNSELHSFSIPLSVDINTGENWGMLH